MGCCSVTARGANAKDDIHEEVELLRIGESKKQSSIGSPSTAVPSGGSTYFHQECTGTILTSGNIHTCLVDKLNQKALFWGKSHNDLNCMILLEPIRGWEGQDIQTYGHIVMSSLAVMQMNQTQEIFECFLVLFPFHLLILTMDHYERRFIYQGLLPLSGMSVVCANASTGHTLQISGPMIEPRQLSCLSSSERNLWMGTLQHHIQEANTHCPPISPNISILPYLVPCDKLWKKKELIKYLMHCPIQKWEGKAIQHLGTAIFLSAARVAHAIDADFEDRLLVLFPDDLVFLSLDAKKTTVTHHGTLPLNAIRVKESIVYNGRLEFLITGDLMEPIVISYLTAEDYNKWIFYLQKPEQDSCSISLRPPPSVPSKHRKR
ncbi:probable pleckstrin homology domain-containing family N member 1 [Spea bombifrons]|uniref:probable pleckstrin homology domain-containing family N member 1 n=1 Tax=Spea bombifrons TaxID=233779 RepID=UPI00234972E4|nr:probable pleckstrin homology domain-containing family N member 1 [Spea bombifrons]